MKKQLRLGSESFWEMTALAMEGWLASCPSCVEHFYFQSWRNAVAFLDSCAAGGLVVRVSLLELRGDIGPRPLPTRRQRWYDQAIYMSAPVFRKENLDASRRRIEATKNAVYNAFRLYYEVLGADSSAIHAAYMSAVDKGDLLRHAEVARQRRDVSLSRVAELRLLLDGFKNRHKDDKLPPGELEKVAKEETTKYVLAFSGQEAAPISVSDHTEELEKFVLDFLSNRSNLEEFTQDGFKLPSDYRLRLLPVIRELAYRLYAMLRGQGEDKAQDFFARVRAGIDRAEDCASTGGDDTYAVTLNGLREDLDHFVRRVDVVPLKELRRDLEEHLDYFVERVNSPAFLAVPDPGRVGPSATA